MRRPVTLVAVVAAAILVSPAAAAAAGWTSPKAVQPGTDPILTFSPTGAAAIGSGTSAHGKLSGSDIDIASNGSSFAKAPYTLPAAGQGQSLAVLALSSDGYLAAGFSNAATPAPVLARVAKPAPSNFATAQELFGLGTATSSQSAPDNLSMLATTDGEIVGAGMDDAGKLYTASLAAKATSFVVAPGPSGLSASDDYDLTADASGDAFLGADGANGCTTVAFRRPAGPFRQTYATGNCSSATPNVFDAITAGGRGQAAILTEDVSESGTGASRLLIQVGRDGHFGTATQLGGVLGAGNVGLAADADGQLTAEWTGCQAGPVLNGELSTTDCAIDAASGTLGGGVTRAAAAGTTLLSASSGTLTALTADRGVAVSDCQGGNCSFSVFTATSRGNFRAGHALGSGQQLIALTGDDHGDLLAVWTNPQGRLESATGSATTGRWSGAHQLSSGPVKASTVAAKYGPKGTAIVAWSAHDTTYAASFSR